MTAANDLAPRDRLLRTLRKEPVDRPPVVCVGGMMNAAVVDVMRQAGDGVPGVYDDAGRMASLAQAVAQHTGFENLALPFCMTLEAELLGSEIDPGSLECEAKIKKEAFASVAEAQIPELRKIPAGSRTERVIEAVDRAARNRPNEPIVGSLTGPVSTAASVVDPVTFLKEFRKNRDGVHRVLDQVTDVLTTFAQALVDAGADLIAISDPTATGEILGPRLFEGFAALYLNHLTDRIHHLGVPVIVHICGDLGPVEAQVAALHADAISTDAAINLARLKGLYPHLVTMGNVSTYMLQFGSPDKISVRTRQLVGEGVDIIAPACGLSTSTRLENIRALTDSVRND